MARRSRQLRVLVLTALVVVVAASVAESTPDRESPRRAAKLALMLVH